MFLNLSWQKLEVGDATIKLLGFAIYGSTVFLDFRCSIVTQKKAEDLSNHGYKYLHEPSILKAYVRESLGSRVRSFGCST